jgi:hypothetical protein
MVGNGGDSPRRRSVHVDTENTGTVRKYKMAPARAIALRAQAREI